MKKYLFFIIAGLLFLVGTPLRILGDYLIYDPNSTSAPFSIYVWIRIIEFIIPAIILVVIGIIFNLKDKKKNEE